MKLSNKVAIITGAGSGIGRATALLFAREGARVVVADVVAAAGEETVAQIKNEGGAAIFAQADVSKAEQVARMVGLAVETYGRLDILFNNPAPKINAKAPPEPIKRRNTPPARLPPATAGR
jgi:NAD(P)-dependent dehydrogenase (short-subunit alcohol dehydrogenase family)